MTPEEQKKQALEAVRAIFEDGEVEINGRVYTFNRMFHKQRRKVFAFYTKVAGRFQIGQDLSFLDTPEFDAVEAVINNAVSIDGSLLSKLGDEHWDKYPEDYTTFIGTALTVISFPFIQGSVTG